jgi:PAS domain S-box-containing protein
MAEDSKFRALLEGAPDAIVMVDADGTIQMINAQAERLFGYARSDMIGQPIEMLVPERARAAHVAHRRSYHQVAHPRPMGAGLDLYGRRRDGTEFPVEISLSPFQTDKGTLIISAIRDITDRRRAEEERHRLLRERAAHEEANRIKDEFIATLSHELRTPLNAIVGWTALLRTGAIAREEQDRALATIERNARAQAQLIEDLLDVSRIISGKLRLQVQLVDLAGVLESAVAVITPAAVAKSIAIDVVMETRPLLVSGDADRLQQAIWNVLSNAVKFTGTGGRVGINLRAAERLAVLRVQDTGRGIRPEFLPFIFDRFRQADSSYAREHGGLGLGLAIARSIVELHGGTIAAHSSGEGFGTVFMMRLPQTQVVTSSAPAPDPRADSTPARLDGVRILVVDDQPDERSLLSAVLASRGATVTAAASADEALRIIGELTPAVVISDLAMPGKDGYELLRELRRAHAALAGIPVIALTAHARTEDRERAFREGFDRYLSKPVDPQRLVAAVASLVGIRPERR